MMNPSNGSESTTVKDRADTIDLGETDPAIDISDAVSEKERVKFTVHTKTKLVTFKESDFSVIRLHEEFIWLHDRFVENDEYAGLILPPAPPRPDFDASRAKLQKLSDSENTLTKEEYQKMKQELEAEYLAMFKKTVSMHEVFLQRLAAHPVLRNDSNFRIFLEFKDDLSVRSKNAREQISGFFRSLSKTADEALLSSHKETDEFFDRQKLFLTTYNAKIKDATNASDKSTRTCKNVADGYIKISSSFGALATADKTRLSDYFIAMAEFFEKTRKLESRIQSDIDLKLSDTLRYYMRDSKAALDLMYRRSRCSVDFETANKNLDRARAKGKEVAQAEQTQQTLKTKFETISEKAKEELIDFKTRRVQMFRKNLIELTELQIKHVKVQIQTIRSTLNHIQTLQS